MNLSEAEALQIAKQAVFAYKERHLTDLQVSVFKGSWQKNTYKKIARELGYTHKYISQQVGPDLWNALSEALEERVYKNNFKGALERWKDSQHMKQKTPHPTPPVLAKVLLGDLRQNSESNLASQLRSDFQAAGIEVSIAGEFDRPGAPGLQLIDAELEQYDCFLLLLSSESVEKSEIILESVKRASSLRHQRGNSKPGILFIHVGSTMTLPLDHALHGYLKDILQRPWQSPTDTPTLIQEVLGLLAAAHKCAPDNDESVSFQQLSTFNNSRNWLLTYVGENQLKKLGDLLADLTDSKERRIQSGYSYWGMGPVQMWNQACNDQTYHMHDNLLRFPEVARKLAHRVDKERYNFVSLGVGDGSKDRSIISDFFNRNGGSQTRDDFVYIPVDMSLDMLRVAIEKIQETNQLSLHRRIGIQRDFETDDGMAEIADIAKKLGDEKPLLYGFIGNTIANVESPKKVLNNIINVMRADDRLLFEAQIINASALEPQQLQKTMESVRREYRSDSFRRFAVSALLQNTDLSIAPSERDKSYVVDVYLQQWEYGELLQIDCFFENNTNRSIDMTLVNYQAIKLDKKERIRLYRSRKFTQATLQSFVRACNLSELGSEHYLSEKGTGFMVMMLERLN